MLEFQHPWFFLFLLILPLLTWRRLSKRGRAVAGWSSLSVVAGGRSWRTQLAFLPSVLEWLGLFALIVALARPQLTNRERVVESEGIDIMLAVDVSGSMESEDFRMRGRKVNRLAVAKGVVADFIENRPHDRIGLVVFGEEAFTQVPLTMDHAALLAFLDAVQIGMAGANRTAIGHAIAVSSRQLASLKAESRVVILLTDGRNNVGPLDPIAAATAANALEVRVHTIGVGSTGGGGFLGLARGDEVDVATLKAVAEATGGRTFRATDTRALREIYAVIDELETTTAEVSEYVHRDELYRKALVPGILFMLLHMVLGQTLFRRLP